jgi:hypothetical protein
LTKRQFHSTMRKMIKTPRICWMIYLTNPLIYSEMMKTAKNKMNLLVIFQNQGVA